MYTQCPDCLSVFSLDAAKLAQARGRVACGHCRTSFDALTRLADQLPAAPVGKLPMHAPSNELPILAALADGPQTSSSALAAHALAPDHPRPSREQLDTSGRVSAATGYAGSPHDAEHAPGTADDAATVASGPQAPLAEPSAGNEPPDAELPAIRALDRPLATEPDFAALSFIPRFAQPKRRRGRLAWIALCIVLALLLLGQLGWAERNALIANPTTGNWLNTLCRSAGCRLPLVQDLHQLRLLARDVQTHPSVNGALMISATLRNEARFPQPYPTLSVTLSDVDGKKLATRRLAPGEYLSDSAALQRGIAAGSNVAVVLEVQDPGSHAVAFELGFE